MHPALVCIRAGDAHVGIILFAPRQAIYSRAGENGPPLPPGEGTSLALGPQAEMPQHDAEYVGVGHHDPGQENRLRGQEDAPLGPLDRRRPVRTLDPRRHPTECPSTPDRSTVPPGRSRACGECRLSGPRPAPVVGKPPVVRLPTPRLGNQAPPRRSADGPARNGPAARPPGPRRCPARRRKTSATRWASRGSPPETKTWENW